MASIYNPTDKEISVVIKGTRYTVAADKVLAGVPIEHANEWKENLHNFIVVVKEEVKEKVVEKVEEVKESMEKEVVPEVLEEKIEDKPVMIKKGKK